MAEAALNVVNIIDRISTTSKRPRYAFMVLNLLAEQANDDGKTGPFVRNAGQDLPLRDWIGLSLARASARGARREALERRVRNALRSELPADPAEAQRVVDRAVAERVQAIGADNFSRVVTELEDAGLVKRFYAGYRTDHAHRGGLRNLVCVVDGDALAALRRRTVLL